MIWISRGMWVAVLVALALVGCTGVNSRRLTDRAQRAPRLPPELTRCDTGNPKRMQALAALQQDVAQFRRLAAAEQRAVDLAQLADSLQSFSTCLAALGRGEEALAASQEEVAMVRMLPLRPESEAWLIQSLRI